MRSLEDVRIGVVGLGYVGLPVAVAFGKARPTVGYDLSTTKVRNLKRHEDVSGEAFRFFQAEGQRTEVILGDDVRHNRGGVGSRLDGVGDRLG